MIPEDAVIHWQQFAPWQTQDMVEQDLIISRALVALYEDPFLREKIAFRGGTAFNKCHQEAAARYSEDIDLVQISDEPIGSLLSAIRNALDPWLSKARWSQTEWLTKLTYRYNSISGQARRLKIEINTIENFSVMPYQQIPIHVASPWFSGEADITTYCLDELMATKMRALYQRLKGRDLFDTWLCLSQNSLNCSNVISIFRQYNQKRNEAISRAQFERNLWHKLQNESFISDVTPLLRGDIHWNSKVAYDMIMRDLISLIPGKPWQREVDKQSNLV